MLPKNVLYYGKEDPLPEQTELRAGPLTVVYEDGNIRYVKYGDREILRRVYVAIRDRNWGTVLPRLSKVQIEAGADSFRVTYEVDHQESEIDFVWKGAIVGDTHGTITFTMDGLARSTFQRNRIGFCILHPIRECAGQPCSVEKADGTVQEGRFPLHIAPHQPFMDMRAISHEVAPGLWAEVRFAGDIFEMEDQRNWTDASYKTYCTPLAVPFPVEVKKGTRVTQSVTLTLKGDAPRRPAVASGTGLTFTVGQAPTAPLPRIGLGTASHPLVPSALSRGDYRGQPLSETELARLKALNLSHLRADLWLSRPGWKTVLERAMAEASALGVALEMALILSDAADDEMKALVAALEAAAAGDSRPSISHWLIFHEKEESTTERWIRLARAHLACLCGYARRQASLVPAAHLASGTNHFFAELNRGCPPTSGMDAVAYSVNPEVHAFDNVSMVENLEAQASSVASARQISGGLPIVVSPVTFRMRFNPNATAAEPEPAPGQMPWRVDVRQMSLFGAGWTAGSLKYLCESGVRCATYYETTGWLGLMEREAGSSAPGVFRSLPGSVFPMYHVFADVGEFAGGHVIPSISSDTLHVDGFTLHKDGKRRVLLSNLTDKQMSVRMFN